MEFEIAPGFIENFPAGQDAQESSEDAPGEDENFPAGHEMQSTLD